MNYALSVVVLLLAGCLMLVSYVERVYAEMGKFLSREFEENIEAFEQRIEPRLGTSRRRASLSMALLAQLIIAATALLIGFIVFHDGRWSATEWVEASLLLVLIVIVFNRLLPYLFFTRTKGEWLIYWTPALRLLIYLSLPVTIVLGFCLSLAALAEEHEPEEPEDSAEAVDALIEAGEEEGILEEGDRELIQSVVEFGDKVVREVMTARPAVFAVPIETTIEQFTELLRQKPHTRVPVYEKDIDHIKGIIIAHDVLQVTDIDARTETVARLMRPAYFVPETKRVNHLLREMQKEKINMAIVVDEYGGTAGLVTIEDLLEEIVGEIGDEHEIQSDVLRESDVSYILSGTVDLGRLEELFGVRQEEVDATTVAGYVSELVGHIPQRGEVIESNGLRFEILDSTDRRVEKLRVSAAHRSQPQATSQPAGGTSRRSQSR
jgi:putative hemolysin